MRDSGFRLNIRTVWGHDGRMKQLACILMCLGMVVLGACKTTKPDDPKPSDATDIAGSPSKTASDPSNDLELQEFLGHLRTAASSRDMALMASLMTPNFGYSLEPLLEGDGVFKFWDDNNLWGELAMVLKEEFVPMDGFLVVPPAFASPSVPYNGYRAGIRKLGGKWKFVYFVAG